MTYENWKEVVLFFHKQEGYIEQLYKEKRLSRREREELIRSIHDSWRKSSFANNPFVKDLPKDVVDYFKKQLT